MNRCPVCNSVHINELTSDTQKMALVEYQIGTEKAGIHPNTCMPVNVYLCSNCHFVGLFGVPAKDSKDILLNDIENKDS